LEEERLWLVMADAKTIIDEFARRVRERLGDHVKHVILYGSHARGDASSDSDYDVLVVVDRRTPEIHDVIVDIEWDLFEETGALLVYLLRSEAVYAEQRSLGMPLYASIEAEGVEF